MNGSQIMILCFPIAPLNVGEMPKMSNELMGEHITLFCKLIKFKDIFIQGHIKMRKYHS